MSRGLTTDLKTSLQAKVVRPILLIEADFGSTIFRVWTGYGSITFEGNTYVGGGHLLQPGEVEETEDTSAKSFQVSLSGVPLDLIAVALNEDYQNRACRMNLATLDASNNVIGSFCQFDGKMDVMTISEQPDTATITVSAESDFITLLKPRVRRNTHEDQQELHSGDNFFEYVAGMQNKPIEWGMKAS
jgi:hypothetical protein